MRANELRIGNWVNSQFGGIQQVVDVMCDGVNTLKYDGINYEFIDPIPLTEEWLLKFGFEEDGEQFNFKGLSIELIGDDGRWCLYMLDEYHNVESSIALFKHVHQLQNLYFSLTGDELTIKEL